MVQTMWKFACIKWNPGLFAFDKGKSKMLDITRFTWQVGADDLFGAGQHLVERHGGGVEDDGVWGGLERGFGAVAVAVVALFQFADDGLFGEKLLLGCERVGGLAVGVLKGGVLAGIGIAGRDRSGSCLTVAAVAADLGGSVEKDFNFRVGEDGGADVAAFHDDASGLA
jgi:hypothetical protein